MSRDLAKELNEWDGQFPPAWRPQEGETLVGTIRRYSTGQGTYGPVRTAIIQRDDGSKVSLWISSTVLLALFQRENPRVGERIGVRYLGKHETKGYRKWSLIVDRPEVQPDFSPLGGEAGELDALPERTTDRGLPYAATTVDHRLPARAAAPAVVAYGPDDDGADPFNR